jgi:lipopolysaccharide biosynthesis protein
MKPVRLIAFYLPQFHPIPENDAWWGRGFTEWTNVTRALPAFAGHRQPRLPADLGFYDLRLAEVRDQQSALARSYGIHGFCYYYYWFGGRRLLERPLDAVLATGRPDFPFCICWANENWTRRWDGLEQEVLMPQDHSPESDRRFILDVMPILSDSRYIRRAGRPVLLVYRPDILPDPQRTVATWRETARAHGLPGLHVVGCQTFGTEDPGPLGFDAAVEFPPHNIRGGRLDSTVAGLHPDFRGKLHDYREAVSYFSQRADPPYLLHRSAMVGWDNTPRRGLHAHVWHHATPDAYGGWLRTAIERSSDPEDPEPLVFVNAWNEWAEGAVLEPDQTWGHTFLQETRRALLFAGGGTGARDTEPDLEGLDQEALRVRLRAFARANAWLRSEVEASEALDHAATTAFTPEAPDWIPSHAAHAGGQMCIESLLPIDASGRVLVLGGRRLRIAGWAVAPGIDGDGEKASASLVLLGADAEPAYFAALPGRLLRPDVARALGSGAVPLASGFAAIVGYEGVVPGTYEIGIVQRGGGLVELTPSGRRICIPGDEP